MSSRLPSAYVRAETVDAAVELLSDDSGARLVAGGYSLLPQVKDGVDIPDRLVDINSINELRGISQLAGETHIGALTTHDRIATSSIARENAHALAEAADSVGDRQAKRQGTIAGNLVFADPKYDAPAAFLALDGHIVTRGPDGERTIGADEWFRGPDETAIESDELVTEVVVPDTERSGYVRTSEYSGYAIIGVAAALDIDSGTVESARVAVNGAKPYPIRLTSVEETLIGETIDDELQSRAADTALRDVDPNTLLANNAAGGQYRLRLVRSYCRESIERATAGN